MKSRALLSLELILSREKRVRRREGPEMLNHGDDSRSLASARQRTRNASLLPSFLSSRPNRGEHDGAVFRMI